MIKTFKLKLTVGLSFILLIVACGYKPPTTMVGITDLKQQKLMKSTQVEFSPNTDFGKLKVLPKKVALISFYVQDAGSKKKIANNTFYSQLTDEGGNYFATKFHDAGLAAMRSAYAKYGIDILTLEEYLDTYSKSDSYKSFTPKAGMILRAALKFANAFESSASGHVKMSSSADGYRVLPVPAEDGKLMNSLDELRQALGVDGFVTVLNHVSTSENEFMFNGIEMALLGPNPVSRVPGKKYPGWSYIDLHLYGKARIDLQPGYAFDFSEKIKNKMPELSENYAGYDLLMGAVSEKLITAINNQD